MQSTKKITRAFELIAASQIVRAQNRIAANRPFRQGMQRIVLKTAREDQGAESLVGTPEDPRRVGVVLIVGDRGLSGPYNSSVLRAAEAVMARHRERGAEVLLYTVGRRAISYFRFRGRDVEHAFIGMADRPTFEDAREVAAPLWHAFDDDQLDLIVLVSTRYHSAGRQTVGVHQLLPLPEPEEASEPTEQGTTQGTPSGGYTEFEPDGASILEHLMPRALESELYSALLEASASEHAARQRAMAAATDNADELVRTLTRTMNRARQDNITTEIMEIVGGAEALRSAKGA